MSHKIHHTEGFIISGSNYGEANRYLSIFTRDFGLVRASAQSVRKVSSKLRFSLQDNFYTRVDLVRGKEIWRVTNAKKFSNFDKIYGDSNILKFLANIFRLTKRLCHGEEQNEEFFDILTETYQFLEAENLTEGDIKNFECVTVLRILHSLGYIGEPSNVSAFVESVITRPILQEAQMSRRILIEEINRSLRESQL